MNKEVSLILIAVLLTASLGAISTFSVSSQPTTKAPPKAQPQTATTQTGSLSLIEQLGKALFFDENLSKNRNMSCATCHSPATGFTGGGDLQASRINLASGVYPGSDSTLYGNTKPPSAAYAGDSPVLHYDQAKGKWVGGMFNDGRATGNELGDPLAEQAMGPFLNPLEMALASPSELQQRVQQSSYAGLFNQVWTGSGVDSDTQQVYVQIGRSIAAYERSREVSQFSSKFDSFWDTAKAKNLTVTAITLANWAMYRNLGLADNEVYGLALFNDPRGANCASCHSMQTGSAGYPLFTDYEYDNAGYPRNPQNPFYANAAYNPQGLSWVDEGVGGTLQKIQPANASTEQGKIKTPTLRNVDKRPSADFARAYGHNGLFKTLPQVVDFYWARGATMCMGRMGMGGMTCMFPPPEVPVNLARLNMFPRQNEPYIYAFLTTLSDGYTQK